MVEIFDINRFPTEILYHMTEFLAISDLANLGATNKRFHKIVKPAFYKTLELLDIINPAACFSVDFPRTEMLFKHWANSKHVRNIEITIPEEGKWHDIYTMFVPFDRVRSIKINHKGHGRCLSVLLASQILTQEHLKALHITADWKAFATDEYMQQFYMSLNEEDSTRKFARIEKLTLVTTEWNDDTCKGIERLFDSIRVCNALDHVESFTIERVEYLDDPLNYTVRPVRDMDLKGKFVRLNLPSVKTAAFKGPEKFGMYGFNILHPDCLSKITDLTFKWSHYTGTYIHTALEKLAGFPNIRRLHLLDESFNYTDRIGRAKYCNQSRQKCSETLVKTFKTLSFVGWYEPPETYEYVGGQSKYRYGWNVERLVRGKFNLHFHA
ncbi:hypothetical protein ABW20_dc0101318 [Dactylellina cionopaga]|nr:hypothetical protein ABW20_dc0101318 [Dactylellina cionopaga]